MLVSQLVSMEIGWLKQIENRMTKRLPMVPHGRMVTATGYMLGLFAQSDKLFRGWNADLCMRGPISPNQVFQIAIVGNIIHQEEIDLLSVLASEYGFDYFIDVNRKTGEILIRCCDTGRIRE